MRSLAIRQLISFGFGRHAIVIGTERGASPDPRGHGLLVRSGWKQSWKLSLLEMVDSKSRASLGLREDSANQRHHDLVAARTHVRVTSQSIEGFDSGSE